MNFGLGFEGAQREHTYGIKSQLLPSLPLSSFGNGKPTLKSLCTQLGKMWFSNRNMFSQVGRLLSSNSCRSDRPDLKP